MASGPTFTEKELADQAGKVKIQSSSRTNRFCISKAHSQKVFIVSGSSAGVGKELAQILYSRNAKVYVAAEKASNVIAQIKSKFPDSKGDLVYLADLTAIKKSAEDFLSKEQRLDVLWNNAGVMATPQGSVTKQGYELQLSTNNVAPFLFTQLLTPILARTAKSARPGSVRVV